MFMWSFYSFDILHFDKIDTFNLLFIALFTSVSPMAFSENNIITRCFISQVKAMESHACRCVAGCCVAHQAFTQLDLKSIQHGRGETQCANTEAFCRGCTTACGVFYKSTTQLLTNTADERQDTAMIRGAALDHGPNSALMEG